jgi:hypothetical protein
MDGIPTASPPPPGKRGYPTSAVCNRRGRPRGGDDPTKSTSAGPQMPERSKVWYPMSTACQTHNSSRNVRFKNKFNSCSRSEALTFCMSMTTNSGGASVKPPPICNEKRALRVRNYLGERSNLPTTEYDPRELEIRSPHFERRDRRHGQQMRPKRRYS